MNIITIELSEIKLKRAARLLEKKTISKGSEREYNVMTWSHVYKDGRMMLLNLRAGKEDYFMEGYMYSNEKKIMAYKRYRDAVTPLAAYTFQISEDRYTIRLIKEPS